LTTRPTTPTGTRTVRESASADGPPLHVHPEWAAAFPWLVQGTTGAGPGGDFDLGLFGREPVGDSLRRWRELREATGLGRAVHSRQVHGAEIAEHDGGPPGLLVMDGWDGHLTDRAGVLLTVSVADCVPISVVDPAGRRVALLHGGWRGTAAGILGRGVARLVARGAAVEDLHIHLGPAICGACYEVGPEVHEALGLPVPGANTPVDVRAVQARQAVDAGVAAERITVSEHCTRCGTGFFSHRGGSPGRQMGVLGIR
jgi:YfiH family protein